VFRKPWFKYSSAALTVLVVLAIASPFLVDVVVRQQLEGLGMTWAKMKREGFQWHITGLETSALNAKHARLNVSLKPSLALRNARLNLHRLLLEPAAPPPAMPDWLYISADPVMLVYGEHAVATGMRARLAKGRLVASGPTMKVKGRWDGQLELEFDGEVIIGEGKFDGIARLRMAQQVEMKIIDAKFADAQNHKVLGTDVSAELAGPGIGRLSGTITADKSTGTLVVSCGKQARSCRLDIQPANHPFAMILTTWPRSEVGPIPVDAPNVAYEFKLGQLSRAQ
jgi:hypothetical protein